VTHCCGSAPRIPSHFASAWCRQAQASWCSSAWPGAAVWKAVSHEALAPMFHPCLPKAHFFQAIYPRAMSLCLRSLRSLQFSLGPERAKDHRLHGQFGLSVQRHTGRLLSTAVLTMRGPVLFTGTSAWRGIRSAGLRVARLALGSYLWLGYAPTTGPWQGWGHHRTSSS
jgi:hypothetical protein